MKAWRGVRRRPAELAGPFRIDQGLDGIGQGGRIDGLGVVGEDASPGGGADPEPVAGAEALIDLVEQILRQRGKDARLGQRAEGAGILGEIDIGRAVLALLEDRRRQLGRVA